jgi:hypothetical protein
MLTFGCGASDAGDGDAVVLCEVWMRCLIDWACYVIAVLYCANLLGGRAADKDVYCGLAKCGCFSLRFRLNPLPFFSCDERSLMIGVFADAQTNSMHIHSLYIPVADVLVCVGSFSSQTQAKQLLQHVQLYKYATTIMVYSAFADE